MKEIIKNGKTQKYIHTCGCCGCTFSYEHSDVIGLGTVLCPNCKNSQTTAKDTLYEKHSEQEQQNRAKKKEYLIPETISEEIFNLPCVIRVQKDEDRKPCYTIEPYSLEVPNIWVRARVGDTLVQLDNGKWKLIKKGE